MSAHTPGPWTAVQMGRVSGVYRIEGPNSEPIAEEGYAPREANARLIAAAPALLEALEEMTGMAERNNYHGMDLAVDRARAAIRAARGENPS